MTPKEIAAALGKLRAVETYLDETIEVTDSPGSLQTLHRVRELQHDALEALEAPAPPAPGSCPGLDNYSRRTPRHCLGCRGDAPTARLAAAGNALATVLLELCHGCEHAVNICSCEERALIAAWRDALALAPPPPRAQTKK